MENEKTTSISEEGEILETKKITSCLSDWRIDNPTPSVLTKLQAARNELSSSGLRKGGTNDYSHYQYFELADFLPAINRICAETKITPIIRYYPEDSMGYIKIFDAESDGTVIFNCPIGDVDLKQSQDIQRKGAMMTYIRRYLYMVAFEIAETDSIERNAGFQEMYQRMKNNGVDPERLAKYLGVTVRELTADQVDEAIRQKTEARAKLAEEKKNEAKKESTASKTLVKEAEAEEAQGPESFVDDEIPF